MANVFFKRGLQANLPSSSANIVDGAFYLTTDTNRLYVGKRNSEDTANVLVELNQSINTVATIGQLPTNTTAQDIGQFYYVTGSNILCIYTGPGTGTSGWTQINPDTSLITESQNTSFSEDSTNHIVTATSVVRDNAATGAHTSTGVFKFKGDANLTVSTEVNPDNSDDVTIIFSPNMDHITSNVNTTYTLGTSHENGANNNVALNLDASGTSTDSAVTLVGAGQVTVAENNNTITITGANPVLKPELEFDANGNLIAGGTVNDVANGTTAAGYTAHIVTPIIKFSDEQNATEYKFNNGTAILPVYTKTEVDDAIDDAKRTIDSMTYKGVIATGDSTSAQEADVTSKLVTNASLANVGDTYKAAHSFTLPGTQTQVNAGDLIIASGRDGNVTWDVVQSGNDQAISVELDDNGRTFVVKDNQIELGGLTLQGSGLITVAGNVPSNSNHTTITISQDTTNYTARTASGGTGTVTQTAAGYSADSTANPPTVSSISYVTDLSVDAYGNVTGVNTQTLNLTDTHNHVTGIEVGGSASANKATISLTPENTDAVSNITAGTFSIESQDLTVTTGGTDGNEISINMVWGSFN